MAWQKHNTLLTSWRAVAALGSQALSDSVSNSSCEGELLASSRKYSEAESLVRQLESGRGRGQSSTQFSSIKWGCRFGGGGGGGGGGGPAASGCLVCINVVQ